MWCFSSLNAFEFRLILFLIGRKYNFSLLKYKALLINGGGGQAGEVVFQHLNVC